MNIGDFEDITIVLDALTYLPKSGKVRREILDAVNQFHLRENKTAWARLVNTSRRHIIRSA